jgi:hypothetical protein
MRFNLQLIPKLLITFLPLALVSSCAETKEAKSARAEARFHSLFKESKFQDIYKEASSHVRSTEKEAEFIAKMREVSQRVGEIQSIEKSSVGMAPPVGGPRDDESWAAYDVKGSNTTCHEFTGWLLEDNEFKLGGYDCSPEFK